jgi:hypothetical protein
VAHVITPIRREIQEVRETQEVGGTQEVGEETGIRFPTLQTFLQKAN